MDTFCFLCFVVVVESMQWVGRRHNGHLRDNIIHHFEVSSALLATISEDEAIVYDSNVFLFGHPVSIDQVILRHARLYFVVRQLSAKLFAIENAELVYPVLVLVGPSYTLLIKFHLE